MKISETAKAAITAAALATTPNLTGNATIENYISQKYPLVETVMDIREGVEAHGEARSREDDENEPIENSEYSTVGPPDETFEMPEFDIKTENPFAEYTEDDFRESSEFSSEDKYSEFVTDSDVTEDSETSEHGEGNKR